MKPEGTLLLRGEGVSTLLHVDDYAQPVEMGAVIVEILDQCAETGELHHALDEWIMSVSDVRADFREVAGRKKRRVAADMASRAVTRSGAIGAAALAACSLLLPAPAAGQRPFTLEQMLGAPFPSNLVSDPEGERVAWVQNARGLRNILVATPPRYEGKLVTSYGEEDGQELADLRFTADGLRIVYVRGGAPNRRGEIPNPALDPGGAGRAIWIVPAEGGEPRRLAEGSSPAASARGGILAFVRAGQIWTVPLDGGQEPSRLFYMRGNPTELRWSPDGRRLAFVSDREDHAFVGVYDLTTRELRYPDPGVEVDCHPVWSPDGNRLAFIRIPVERRNVRFVLRRSGLPWSIRLIDLEKGDARTIWTAASGAGSVFVGVEGERQLAWGAGDRLVFPWEREGWLHLYSVLAEGGPATPLTPGEGEVEHVTLGPGGREIVFSSNRGDPDRKHLWRVPVDGGPVRPVTTGSGIEWSPVVLSEGSAIALLRSDARRPAHAAVFLSSGDVRVLAPGTLPEDFPLDDLVEPEAVTIRSADGMRVHAQLFLPREGERARRHPAVVFAHGGSRRQMLLGWHPLEYYHRAYGFNQYLASRGYIVLSVNYRSGTGYGLEFREAEDFGARGASEFNDIVSAALYLSSRPDVDPDRIGIWGGSYGGFLTALALARASNLFAAGVDFHGVHDWNVEMRIDDPGFADAFQSSFDPETRNELERLAHQSSPVGHLDTWRSPVLFIHGDDDRNGPFRQTVELTHALRRRGVPVELLVFPDEVHSFLLHSNWLRAYRQAEDFFARTLAAR